MDHVTGKSRGRFGVSNHRNMWRWFERFPDKSATSPFESGKRVNQRCPRQDKGKSATSATRRGGDVAEKSTGTSRVTGLSQTCHGEVSIMEFGRKRCIVHMHITENRIPNKS